MFYQQKHLLLSCNICPTVFFKYSHKEVIPLTFANMKCSDEILINKMKAILITLTF